MHRVNIYIDGNNLHRGAKELGFTIDYRKFKIWLSQKFKAKEIFLFLGFIAHYESLYKRLTEHGFIIIFKETVIAGDIIKGNCDAELVLKVVSDFYTDSFDLCHLVTGDGDFVCLIDFLSENKALSGVIAPRTERCSLLIKKKPVKIFFLDDHYHKFSKPVFIK